MSYKPSSKNRPKRPWCKNSTALTSKSRKTRTKACQTIKWTTKISKILFKCPKSLIPISIIKGILLWGLSIFLRDIMATSYSRALCFLRLRIILILRGDLLQALMIPYSRCHPCELMRPMSISKVLHDKPKWTRQTQLKVLKRAKIGKIIWELNASSISMKIRSNSGTKRSITSRISAIIRPSMMFNWPRKLQAKYLKFTRVLESHKRFWSSSHLRTQDTTSPITTPMTRFWTQIRATSKSVLLKTKDMSAET